MTRVDPEDEQSGDHHEEVGAGQEHEVSVGGVAHPGPGVDEHVDRVGDDAEGGQGRQPEKTGKIQEKNQKIIHDDDDDVVEPGIQRRVVFMLQVRADAWKMQNS